MLSLRWLTLVCRWSTIFFFFNDTATTEIYTLSLHDALPILAGSGRRAHGGRIREQGPHGDVELQSVEYLPIDRKNTRLNSRHQIISYAVFCLKKKKEKALVFGLWVIISFNYVGFGSLLGDKF